jgi:hypothetical protein
MRSTLDLISPVIIDRQDPAGWMRMSRRDVDGLDGCGGIARGARRGAIR